MEKVTMDFGFNPLSLEYGQFLFVCYSTCPDITILNVTGLYESLSSKLFVSMYIPTDVAMLLKLQFGNYITKRPEVAKEGIINMKILKNRNSKEDYYLKAFDFDMLKNKFYSGDDWSNVK